MFREDLTILVAERASDSEGTPWRYLRKLNELVGNLVACARFVRKKDGRFKGYVVQS